MPTDPMVGDAPEPLMDRVDATGDGDPHFYFMPPVARQLFPYRGVFEPRAREDLRVIVGRADLTPPPSGEELPVFVNRTHEFYEARWDAPADPILASVSVWLGQKRLGSLLLQPASTRAEEREARQRGDGVFTPGTRVQIRFRVEVGAGEGVFGRPPGFGDGRNEGDPRLQFVPPTAVSMEHGPFNSDVLADLAVEVWATSDIGSSTLIKRFSPDGPSERDRVRMNRNQEFYTAIWATDGVPPWLAYRADVFLGQERLGWTAIDVVPLDLRGPGWSYELGLYHRAKRARAAYVVLSGNEVHIRFRVERGEGVGSERIAFRSGRDGQNEIYVMNADGTDQTRLTNDPRGSKGHQWSPDGSRILFGDGSGELYVMDPDGTDQTSVTHGVGGHQQPQWSPDGTRIAAYFDPGPGQSEIYVMNVDGTDRVNVSNDPSIDAEPRWSPDGRRIAFRSWRDTNGIFVVNADGSDLSRLTDAHHSDHDPQWSPAGGKIAFVSSRDRGTHIFVVDADGSEQTNLSDSPDVDREWDHDPRWSPDGSQIAFVRVGQGVHVMNADGSELTRLTPIDADYGDIDWSPDGTRIAFYSDMDDSRQIWVVDADGTNLRRLTNSAGGNFDPRWAPW